MITTLLSNSAAAIPHPSDPNLKIQLVSLVSQDGKSAAGADTVRDSTGAYSFDLSSLSSALTYDISGNPVTITYGPDANGRSIRQTSTWTNGVWMGDSAWVLV